MNKLSSKLRPHHSLLLAVALALRPHEALAVSAWGTILPDMGPNGSGAFGRCVIASDLISDYANGARKLDIGACSLNLGLVDINDACPIILTANNQIGTCSHKTQETEEGACGTSAFLIGSGYEDNIDNDVHLYPIAVNRLIDGQGCHDDPGEEGYEEFCQMYPEYCC
jgi:hypothetical protein